MVDTAKKHSTAAKQTKEQTSVSIADKSAVPHPKLTWFSYTNHLTGWSWPAGISSMEDEPASGASGIGHAKPIV